MYGYMQCSVSNYAAVRWNGTSKCFEAQDNYGSWFRIDIDIPILPDATELLEYVRTIRRRDQELEALRAKYPSLDKVLEHAELIKVICETEEARSPVPTV